jgi:hypothetical protein
MNTHIATTRTPARTRSSKDLLLVSAVAYLTLALGLGVHFAFYLVALAAVIALWAALCRRFPIVSYLTGVFFNSFLLGLISGLFGYRSGYAYRPRYRRRRR